MKKIFAIFIIITGFICAFKISAQAALQEMPHWVKSPITVYIPQDTYKQTMRHAFERWQSNSYGMLKFSFVDKGPADIDVVFTDKVDGSDGPVGTYSITIKNKEIVKAEIQIATKGEAVKKYSKNYIFTTMVHEVGHALGLEHNPRKKTSIMYTPLDASRELIKVDIVQLFKLNNWDWREKPGQTRLPAI